MFDCVIQTRHSRSGMFYTSQGRMRLTDSKYKNDMYPVDTSCDCYTCTNFTRAYVHHLFKIGDIFSATLATIHNLTWFAKFMANMRQSIVEGRFEEYRKWVHEVYPPTTGAPHNPITKAVSPSPNKNTQRSKNTKKTNPKTLKNVPSTSERNAKFRNERNEIMRGKIWKMGTSQQWFLIFADLGPTNTGKTHRALQRMLELKRGIIGLPLRLLAREVYDKLVAQTDVRDVALFTGERILPNRPKYYVCTVESMPMDITVPIVVVDEIQLATHPKRGHIFTDRILNARGTVETWFLGSDTMTDILKTLVPTVDIKSSKRLSPLKHIPSQAIVCTSETNRHRLIQHHTSVRTRGSNEDCKGRRCIGHGSHVTTISKCASGTLSIWVKSTPHCNRRDWTWDST